jgi:hypothetical protein
LKNLELSLKTKSIHAIKTEFFWWFTKDKESKAIKNGITTKDKEKKAIKKYKNQKRQTIILFVLIILVPLRFILKGTRGIIK